MKQVAYVQIQVEKDENLYIFSMPMGAALADAAEVSFRVFKAIDQMYRDAIDKELKAQETKSQELKAQETEAQESKVKEAMSEKTKIVGNGT